MKLVVAGRELRHFAPAFGLSTDPYLLSDGTLWSHAATLGSRTKGGSEFCIDRACVENFVKVFTAGYPQKILVDYNHSSTTDDPVARGLGYQGSAPKAGDVLELTGVFSVGDFTGDLKNTAVALAAKASRPLDDPRNFGLWMRWKPTGRALASIKAGEYTELSIAFDDDLPNNVDGAGQGPGLWAVALLNTPFLDDMLPVAASRDTPPPAGNRPAQSTESPMTLSQKILSLVSAVRGKTVATEDDVVTELTAQQTEITELRTSREYRDVVSAEFGGEKDAAKVVAKVRELNAKLTAAEAAATTQKKAAIKATVDATIKAYEKVLGSVPLRTMLTNALTKELDEGKELDKTETMATLKSLSPAVNLTQSAGPDVGGAGVDDDKKIDARAQELMRDDPEIKALAAKDWSAGYRQASQRAYRELATV